MNKNCPFCEIVKSDSAGRIINQNKYGFVMRDGYPLSNGHTLVIPKRHIASFFDLSSDERQALFELLEQSKMELDVDLRADAYNIGINDGVAAGQTVAHLHIHLIPRYEGDMEDPRGGIRWIFPDRAKYWE